MRSQVFNKIRTILFLFLLAGFQNLRAQEDGLLWQVSGNGLSKPSYLFGTVHLYCNPSLASDSILLNAIESSAIIALEINFFDYETKVAMLKAQMRPAEKPLSSLLKGKDYQLVDSVCLAILGDSLKTFDSRTPMFLNALIMMNEKISGCSESLPVDLIVGSLGMRSGKEIFGLETVQYQDSLLNSIPDSLQVKWLLEICANLGKAKSEFEKLTRMYEQNMSLALYDEIIASSPEIKYFKEELLTNRNYRWTKFMADNMGQTSLFLSVGAAHLGGADGLIASLRGMGYTVTPIKMNNR